MSAKFYPKPAKFESKSQIAPNWIVFNPKMGDSAVRFLLALNGIATCGGNWVPIQSDIQKRLGWGEKKMRNAIEECKRLGYLIVRQNHNPKGTKTEDGEKVGGQYTPNEFEYDLNGGYLKKDYNNTKEKPSHNEYEPSALKGNAVEGNAAEEALVVPLDEVVSLDKLVCVDSPPVGASPQEKDHEKVKKKKFDGSTFEVSKSDLFTRAIQKWKDWTTQEIDEAWRVFVAYEDPIREWFSFCEGTIKNLRKLAAIKNFKLQENECQNKKKNQNHYTSNPTSPMKTESESSKNETLTKGTWGRHLANWRSQIGLPQ